MASDNPDSDAIVGDVIYNGIRRVSGEPGGDGLIEIPLFGHQHLYRVRVDRSGAAPRLVELHIVPADETAEIDPATIRQVPVRRLAKAAARFTAWGETEFGSIISVHESHNPTLLTRPDYDPKRRTLDDVHYRNVAELLIHARETGQSRMWVADQLHTTKPTLDRWIAEAKRRMFLPRNWATTNEPMTVKGIDR